MDEPGWTGALDFMLKVQMCMQNSKYRFSIECRVVECRRVDRVDVFYHFKKPSSRNWIQTQKDFVCTTDEDVQHIRMRCVLHIHFDFENLDDYHTGDRALHARHVMIIEEIGALHTRNAMRLPTSRL